MAVRSGGSSSSVRSLPPPCPKSPPEYPDLYGKRRGAAKIQILEREISVLEQEELKSVDGLQPASRYCKEYEPEESEVMSVLEVALVPISCSSVLCYSLLVGIYVYMTDTANLRLACILTEFPVLTCHGSAVAALPVHAFATYVTAAPANVARRTAVHANAARLTRVHASATQVIAVHVSAEPATALHVTAAACATAVRASAAACATAVHVSAALVIAFRATTAARATAAHVQAAARSQNGDANAAHATVVRVQPAARSRNGNASAAAHATAAHVQAAARSRNGNVSRVPNPIASERCHAAAGTQTVPQLVGHEKPRFKLELQEQDTVPVKELRHRICHMLAADSERV
ncbi:hypothetical protein GQ457_08G003460 [Hibiscus cannabinus]